MCCSIRLVMGILLFSIPSPTLFHGSAAAFPDRKNVQQPFASAARTTSVNSSSFDVGDADVLVCYLSVTAASGTTPTLDVKFQDTNDNGTTFFDIVGTSFTQVTSSPSTQIVSATRKFSRKVRCVVTIAGTTPSFTFHVEMLTY